MLWNDTESQTNVTNDKKDTIIIFFYSIAWILNTNKIELKIKTIHTKKTNIILN